MNDKIYRVILFIAALIVPVVCGGVVYALVTDAYEAFEHFGFFKFLTSSAHFEIGQVVHFRVEIPVVPVRLYRHKFARIPNRNLAVEVKESIAYAYAMPMA